LGELGTGLTAGEIHHQDERTRLLDRLGEVEVAFANFSSYLDRTVRALAADTGSLRHTSEQLEDQIRRARLVPMEWLYSRLGSAMRELERSCRRPVDMVVTGGEVELDKSVVDQLTDPLLHLLRNALAHGIESAMVRAERGKPPRGRIEIKTVQEGDCVFITFEDDGGGSIGKPSARRCCAPGAKLRLPSWMTRAWSRRSSSRGSPVGPNQTRWPAEAWVSTSSSAPSRTWAAR
jgi:C4-dicarboxylate-specific signal transduction histidine kinase